MAWCSQTVNAYNDTDMCSKIYNISVSYRMYLRWKREQLDVHLIYAGGAINSSNTELGEDDAAVKLLSLNLEMYESIYKMWPIYTWWYMSNILKVTKWQESVKQNLIWDFCNKLEFTAKKLIESSSFDRLYIMCCLNFVTF